MARKDILSSSRKIKRKRKIFKSIALFVVFASVLYGLIYLANLSKFRIKNVESQSDNKILNEEVKKSVAKIIEGKYFKILPKDNIFLLPKDEIEAFLIKEFPRIKSASIEVELPDKILIKFDERKQEAILCYGKECGFLDESGFVFEKAPYFSGDAYIKFIDKTSSTTDRSLAIGKNIIEAGKFEKIMYFINLSNKAGIIITKVNLLEEDIYELITKEGWGIFIDGGMTDMDRAFDNLMVGLEEKIKGRRKDLDYIILRFDNKIPYSFKK